MNESSFLAGKLFLGLLALLFSCKDASKSECKPGSPSYTTQIVPLIDKYCVFCHSLINSTAGVDLSSYTAVKSNLTSLVTVQNGPIPVHMNMKAEEVALIKQWISCGAMDDSPKIPPLFFPACSPDTLFFKNDILPLVTLVCGNKGCHGGVGRLASSLTDYPAIVNTLGTTSRLNTALAGMIARNVAGYTPPDSSQIAWLLKWIQQGAKNDSCSLDCDTTQFTYAAVVAPILQSYCVGCHSSLTNSGGVDLSSYGKVMAYLLPAPNGLLGSLEQVSPYTGAKAMPPGGLRLPQCQVIQIRNWINSGAPNN